MEQNVIPSFSYDSKEIIKKIEETRENKLWVEEKIEEFRKGYPDQFIAIYKKKIIGNNSDPKLLIQFLRTKDEFANNLDMIAIEFISGEDYYLIL